MSQNSERFTITTGTHSEDAIALLEAEYRLARPCFLDPISDDEVLELVKTAHQARSELLVSARSALGLRERKGTGDFELNLSWREVMFASS